jgi:hypothetical protein
MPRVARVGATQLMLLVDGAIAAVLVRGDPKMAGAAREAARFLLIAAGRAADPSDAPVRDHFRGWPIATLPQEFMSAVPPKADKPEPTRMIHSGPIGSLYVRTWSIERRAAQKTAGRGLKPSDRQHQIVSAIIGRSIFLADS